MNRDIIILIRVMYKRIKRIIIPCSFKNKRMRLLTRVYGIYRSIDSRVAGHLRTLLCTDVCPCPLRWQKNLMRQSSQENGLYSFFFFFGLSALKSDETFVLPSWPSFRLVRSHAMRLVAV